MGDDISQIMHALGFTLHDVAGPGAVFVGKAAYKWYQSGTLASSLERAKHRLGLGLSMIILYRRILPRQEALQLLTTFLRCAERAKGLEAELKLLRKCRFPARIYRSFKKRQKGEEFEEDVEEFYSEVERTSTLARAQRAQRDLEALDLSVPEHQQQGSNDIFAVVIGRSGQSDEAIRRLISALRASLGENDDTTAVVYPAQTANPFEGPDSPMMSRMSSPQQADDDVAGETSLSIELTVNPISTQSDALGDSMYNDDT